MVIRQSSDGLKKAAGFDFTAASLPAAAKRLRAGPSASGGTMSNKYEGTPALARCAEMRAPMVPAPRTATLSIRFCMDGQALQLLAGAITPDDGYLDSDEMQAARDYELRLCAAPNSRSR